MKMIDGIMKVDEHLEKDSVEFTLDFSDFEGDINPRIINGVMTYAEDEGYKCFPLSHDGDVVGFRALKIMMPDVVSVGEPKSTIPHKVYLVNTEDVDHNCIVRLKSGRFSKPISGAQARRAVKEGCQAYHIYLIGPTSEKPSVGGYYMYRGELSGPYKDGDGSKSTIYYGGKVVASTDPKLHKEGKSMKITDNIIDFIVNSPVIPLFINLSRDEMRNIWVGDNGEMIFGKTKDYYLPSELDDILLEVMNLGMGLRQNQLNGSNLRSGKDVLNDWKKENL